MLGDQVA